MQTATLNRRRPGHGPDPDDGPARPRTPRAPVVALVALTLGAVVAFLIYPTFPNYDSYYSLLWGRELVDLQTPSFDAYRAPTQHPLAVFFGAALSLVGDDADRLLILATFVSFVLLAVGLYRLGRIAFTPAIGLVAAILLCTRFDFAFLAARGYIDVAYLAAVIWAAALEAERPRRGVPVFVLLVLASLMRPEAWLLAGVYFLWMFPGATWRRRALYAVLTWLGTAIWVALDFWATGDPVFSLTHTSELAGELGRSRPVAETPGLAVQYLKELDKLPVFALGLVGLAVAAYAVPRRLAMPLALFAIGMGTFGLVGLAGLSVIDRYLLVPSLMVMLFAGVALAGWSMLERGRVRTAWIRVAVLVALVGAVFTAFNVKLETFDADLRYRGEAHASLEEVLARPAVRAGMRCGPVTTPNHKLVPDVRWILGAGVGDVLARADPATGSRADSGVALYVTNRAALIRQALVEDNDDPADSVPLPGFRRVATTSYYAAYVRC